MEYQPQGGSFSTPEFKICQWVTYNPYAPHGELLWVPCSRRVLYKGLCGEHIKDWLEADKMKKLKKRYFGQPPQAHHSKYRRNGGKESRRRKARECPDCGIQRSFFRSPTHPDGWRGYHGYCIMCHFRRSGLGTCPKCPVPKTLSYHMVCPCGTSNFSPDPDKPCGRCGGKMIINDPTNYRRNLNKHHQRRCNPDEEIRRLERELSVSPNDTNLQGRLIAHYNRNDWSWVLCEACEHLYPHQEPRQCGQCIYQETENAERYLCHNCAALCSHCNTPNALAEHIYGCSEHIGICAGCNKPVHDDIDCSSRCSRCDRQACDNCRMSVEEPEIFGVPSFTVCPPCHEEALQQIEQYNQLRQDALELHGSYTCDEIENMPTIDSSHFSNTLLRDGDIRVLRSRMTIAGGAMFDHAVEIEVLNQIRGRWEMVAEYDCHNPEEIFIHHNEE